MAKTTFKVGDKVRITNTNQYIRAEIGDIATVTSINKCLDGGNGYMLRNGPATLQEHESNDTGYHYFFCEGQFEFELVKENYNLNQMYPWNGGECPVHPESTVRYWMRVGNRDGYETKAKGLRWNNSSYSFSNDIVAFKVTKEYVEPKPIEGYVNVHHDGSTSFFAIKEHAKLYSYSGDTRVAVHLKEV